MTHSHSFCVEHAELYGIECAILINHFQFWIEQNRAMKRNFHDGRTWMYQTQKEIAAIYPYLGEDTIQRILKKLELDGVIIKGNYNRTPLDRTTWYAFKDEKMFTKPRNRIMDSSDENNRIREIASLPDTKQIANHKEQQQAAVVSNNSFNSEQQQPQEKQSSGKTGQLQPYDKNVQLKQKPKIYACLESQEIPSNVKIDLTRDYSEETVKNAIEWAETQRGKIKTTWVATLIHGCKKGLCVEKQMDPTRKESDEVERAAINRTHWRVIEGILFDCKIQERFSFSFDCVRTELNALPVSYYFKEEKFLSSIKYMLEKKGYLVEKIIQYIDQASK